MSNKKKQPIVVSAYSDMPDRVIFTEEMKETHTILIPNMLPRHFKILSRVFNNYGYKTELLTDGLNGDSRTVIDAGLKYVHNDACYPALLVIGQFIAALKSGRYDTNKVALLLSQTGGGCRASNYISLLRKALVKAGFAHVPVISLNFSGLESMPGFKITLPMIPRLMYAILYGDLIMMLVNQCRPYEKVKGESERLADEWSDRLANEMTIAGGSRKKAKAAMKYKNVLANYRAIVKDFAAIEGVSERRTNPKVRVGVVGEIYVKFSPLGNNDLENFLVSEGAEPVLAGLLDFCMYVVTNNMMDYELYGIGKTRAKIYKIADKFFLGKQKDLIDVVREEPLFDPPTPFDHTRTLARDYVGMGAKMGEGWLLTAEILELIDEGVNSVVITQPFGCLPNHIVGKGMMKPIKENMPDVNLVAIDYDAGATKINQDNRIKLMLANAKK